MYALLSDIRAALIEHVGKRIASNHEQLYVTATTQQREWVGTINLSEEDTIDLLLSMDAGPNYLAAFKTLGGTDEQEIGSWSWRGTYDEETETFTHDEYADKQLHIIMWELDGEEGTTALTAHWEYSWKTNPVKHYLGRGMDDEKGAQMFRTLLEQHLDNYDACVDETFPDNL